MLIVAFINKIAQDGALDTLRGYVITLQNFEKCLKEGQQKGLVTISERTIDIREEAPELQDATNESKTSNTTKV